MQTQIKQSETGAATAAPKLRNYVDGAWVTPQTANYLDVTNPANGETIAQVPISTKEDTDAAVAAAHAAFPACAPRRLWSARACYSRLKHAWKSASKTLPTRSRGSTARPWRTRAAQCAAL